jgi:hypothetical protein
VLKQAEAVSPVTYVATELGERAPLYKATSTEGDSHFQHIRANWLRKLWKFSWTKEQLCENFVIDTPEMNYLKAGLRLHAYKPEGTVLHLCR